MGVRYRNDRARFERLRGELAEILPTLVDDKTERVVLFGSAARGDVGATSDLDLLVVRRDSRRPVERIDALYRRARPRIAIDMIVYTPEELSKAMEESSFLRTALREGEVLYARSPALA